MTISNLSFNLSSLEALLPEIIVAALAILLLMLDLFIRGDQKRLLTWVSVGGYVLALGVCLVYFFSIGNTPGYFFGTGTPDAPYTGAMLVSDHLAYFFRILAIMTALLGTLFAATYVEERGMPLGEFHAVLALLTLGAMLVAASVDLIMIFLGIELMSISTYILVGFARNDRLSNEGSLKYFLLGTFATAILVYGMAWLFGMTGTTNLPQIAHRLQAIGNGVNSSGVVLAIVLLVVGLGFKIAAVPFHMWTPDAYQGAPTPVTAIISVGPKAAGFAAIIRILIEGLGPAYQQWVPLIIFIAILTMTLGNVVGLMQQSVKRMLAYSSIAHTGYMLIGIAAFQPQLATSTATNDAVASVLFYLFSYVIMNIGAFGLVVWLQHNHGTEFLDDFRGLSTWAPGPALVMMVLLLSLAGIPPTIGFFGKYYVFVAALRSGLGWLAVIGVLNSAIAAFYYLRVIWYMYFEQPKAARQPVPSRLLVGGLVLTAALVFIFFVAAGPVLDMARQALPLVMAAGAPVGR